MLTIKKLIKFDNQLKKLKMKKLGILAGLLVALTIGSCDVLEGVAGTALGGGGGDDGGTNTPSLTNGEVIAGLKEALQVGIKNGASRASALDGFNKNPLIYIPWPEEAVKLKEWGMNNGFSGKVTEIETNFNRAAEEASKKAVPIFVDAITNMTVSDGFDILRGADTAATVFLMKTTSAPLKTAFKPVVKDAIDKVKLTSIWEPVANGYNKVAKFTGKEQVNTDLVEYVTDRGMSGLFTLVKAEERKIRKDPIAQVTDLLKKVFGSVMGNN
ncbi:MAG: hypothetical protein ACI857_001383 [Arenicella sp.]